MKLPTDWQFRHAFMIQIIAGFAFFAMGLVFMDGFIACMGIGLIVAVSVFESILPEHNDPWRIDKKDKPKN